MGQRPEHRREPAGRHDRAGGEPAERDEEQLLDSLDEPDFAAEHTSPTFADEQAGGPESSPEPESPKGYAGPDWGRRRRRRRRDRSK